VGAGAAPAAASSAPTGTLQLRVQPSAAQIVLDGRPAGQAGVMNGAVAAGVRHMHITASGYADFDTTLVIAAGKTTQLPDITLKGAGAH
jgi:hypothetical protein